MSAPLARRFRVTAGTSYPFADALRWLHAVARQECPQDPALEGLWIDCGLIGTIEQVALNHDAKPVIDVELTGPMDGVLVVRAR